MLERHFLIIDDMFTLSLLFFTKDVIDKSYHIIVKVVTLRLIYIINSYIKNLRHFLLTYA